MKLLRNIVVVIVLASPIVSADDAGNLRSKAGKGDKSRVHKVRKGDSIQDAIDDADPGDIIKVWPGVYTEQASSLYGLRISTNNIKLMAKGGPGSVRLIASGAQETGVYAAPEGCEYKDNDCDEEILENFSIEGFSVEGFPVNGIQTRWVDGFIVENCYSVGNLNNGIYPTLSSNGRIAGSTASGSLDAGLWIAGSADITALDNEIYESTTGFEVTVSRNLYVSNNKIHDNTVGIGLYHPNMAGTKPDWTTYENWTFEGNHVYENNLPNPAPPDTFQYGLEPGVGALLIGVSSHTIEGNIFDGNGWAGIIVAGYCTVVQLAFGSDCTNSPPINGDPSANFNSIVGNKISDSGSSPALGLPGADILYVQVPTELLAADENCFTNNTSIDGSQDATTFAPFLPLSVAGCD